MTDPAIDLRDMRFGWQPGTPVLEIPRFVVERGERVLLHGPSGSGKSTLLGLVGGVVEPRGGAVRLLGQDLAALSRSGRDAFRAEHLGFIFQLFNLVPYLSVLENVLLPLRFSAERRARVAEPRGDALRLLAALGLEDRDLMQRKVTALSVGQQQRVAAARALLGQAEILVADEPTSSLDAVARESFLRLLMQECAAAGTSVLFVSHDHALGAWFDRSVALHQINRVQARESRS